MSDQHAIELVFARNAFYRRMHFLVLAAFALALIVIALLIWCVVYLFKNPVHPLYFPTDNVGRLIKIIPVNTPNMSNDDVLKWTINGVQAAYSFDYINYRSQLQDAQKYFTSYGWRNYMNALNTSNNLLAVTQRKMISTAQIAGPAKLLAEGLLSGAYAWKYEMPVLVTYSLPPYDEQSKFYNPLIVTVIVQRQQPLQGYQGLGILQIISTLQTTSTPAQVISNLPSG